jgi:hypothetical protein
MHDGGLWEVYVEDGEEVWEGGVLGNLGGLKRLKSVCVKVWCGVTRRVTVEDFS